MPKSKPKRILVVGCGNTLRTDDGVGVYVAGRIASFELNGVDVTFAQQLNPELIEDFIQYRKIIVVDAAVDGIPIELKKIEPAKNPGMSSSHHLAPEVLVNLALKLYHHPLNLFVCSVRGENFDFGSSLTFPAEKRAEEAVDLIRSIIDKDIQHA